MSALEQSLDAIIASDKPKGPRSRKVNAVRGKAGKSVSSSRQRGRASIVPALNRKRLQAAASKALNKKTQKPKQPSQSVVSASAVNYAQKVVVSGLPKDIKTESVKEFFQSQVGGIQSVTLSYNAKGQPSGNATVIFKQPKFAQDAVTKYNNSPIDAGRSKLRLELVVDPSLKPLADRITPNPVAVNAPTHDKKARLQQKAKARKGGLGNSGTGRERKAGNGNKKTGAKNKRPTKKTVEQLDQEMADYFSTNDK